MNDLVDGGVDNLSEQVRVRYQKLSNLKETDKQPYKNGLSPKDVSLDLHGQYDSLSKEELESKKVSISIAGRIMAIRHFGKAAFIRIKDRKGYIQVFMQKSRLGDDLFAKYRTLDVGDILFIQGDLFKTKTNELSVFCNSFELMTKSLRPLPEKFHGLTDVEIKYRQRYLDLMMNDQVKENFYIRAQVIQEIRSFFVKRGFTEVETPMMHPLVGGAAARPFVTHHNTLNMELFLRIAPELYLKRLLVGGMDRVFEINRNFRNEGISIQHNPEFTMIEFYQAYATYEDLMLLTQDLFQTLAKNILNSETITYQGTEINFTGDWEKISVEDSIVKYSDFNEKSKLRDKESLVQYLDQKGFAYNPSFNIGQLMMVIFDKEVESKLIQPTFVTQYPLDVSPLSRKNEKDPFCVDRFELFIYGREIANAFSELNDPMDQKERFEEQVAAKQAGDKEACDMDEDYITALEFGMPPAAGQGIGIDRLVMLFTDSASIRDVILFPQLRSKN